ncbi:hypothetical protein BFP97_07220 [Roseivirga sp. 4D4]|uniref:hypothetical protein n=1 Tax=Roseivirga sp. 4D4 TaxID=1889784 RepID=UPI0008531F87|nr:hypothetical protein [Roseivirga sp. 4D4]OEK01317.1 hypothetical protein BFP97_07220 [Roseivirga sp. 4D4]
MNGAGFMLDAIKSLRSNRALLRKRTGAFNIKDHNGFKDKPISAYRKYSFKKATPTYMRKLRAKLSADRKARKIKMIASLIFSIVLVTSLILAL